MPKSTPPSPELEPFCKNCGGIRSAHIPWGAKGLRCMLERDTWFVARADAPPPSPPTDADYEKAGHVMPCAGDADGTSATPSPPEPRDEPLDADTEACLDAYVQTALATRDADRDDSPALVDCGVKEILARDALRAHIRALYTRQREEYFKVLEANGWIAKQWADGEDQINALSSQLERLKAERLTPEMIEHIRSQLHVAEPPGSFCKECQAIDAALRLQSRGNDA